MAVITPALEIIGIEDSAGVVKPERDLFGREVITEVDSGQIIAHFISAVTSLRGVAIAESTILVNAPTLDGIIIKDGAGMIFACTNRLGGMPTTQIDKL